MLWRKLQGWTLAWPEPLYCLPLHPPLLPPTIGARCGMLRRAPQVYTSFGFSPESPRKPGDPTQRPCIETYSPLHGSRGVGHDMPQRGQQRKQVYSLTVIPGRTTGSFFSPLSPRCTPAHRGWQHSGHCCIDIMQARAWLSWPRGAAE